jgi:3-oxoacyl-[acyl-carrier protein] reductase
LTPILLSKDTPETIAETAEKILLKRYGQPEEIGYAITFLCSPEADYITGQVLSPNGGLVIG